MTSFRDIPHSATKESVRLAVPAAVSDSSHVLLCFGVPTETVGNKSMKTREGLTMTVLFTGGSPSPRGHSKEDPRGQKSKQEPRRPDLSRTPL